MILKQIDLLGPVDKTRDILSSTYKYQKQKLILDKSLLDARHWAKYFEYYILLTQHCEYIWNHKDTNIWLWYEE